MTSPTLTNQLEIDSVPPPPYPPPLPLELEVLGESSLLVQEQEDKSVTSLRDRSKALQKSAKKRSEQLLLDMAPKLSDISDQLRTLFTNLKKLIKLKAPVLAKELKNNISKAKKQSGGVLDYVQEEAPLYSAFITIGSIVLIISILLAFFISPAVWIIMALASIVQLLVGFGMKANRS